MMMQVTKLEAKVCQIEEKLNNPVLLKADKELILVVDMEEKVAKADLEQRKLSFIVHKLPENKQDALEERIRDGSKIDLSMLTEAKLRCGD